jgi:hypothetical protein
LTDLATRIISTLGRLASAAAVALLAAAAPSGEARAREPESVRAPALPIIVARQAKPARERLDANVAEVLKALDRAGVDVPAADREALAATKDMPDALALGETQKVLDRYALALVDINDEAWFSITSATSDPAERPIERLKWRTFLVKVNNNARATSPFEVRSLQAVGGVGDGVVSAEPGRGACEDAAHGWAQWFRLRMVGEPLMPARLSGKEVEYFVVQMCSLEAGDRAAEFTFYLGGGQVSQGHYGAIGLLFRPTAGPVAGR